MRVLLTVSTNFPDNPRTCRTRFLSFLLYYTSLTERFVANLYNFITHNCIQISLEVGKIVIYICTAEKS